MRSATRSESCAKSHRPVANVAYLDSSAIVKLIKWEPETDELRAQLVDRDLFSCSLALTEVPRAVQGAARSEESVDLAQLLDTANQVLESINLIELDNSLLTVAGAIGLPGLRSLDAIHLAAASGLPVVSDLYTYDERQAASALALDFRVATPGRR